MDAKSSAGVPLSSPAAAQRCAKGAGLDSGAAAAAQSAMPSIALPATASTADLLSTNAAAPAAPQLPSVSNLHQLDGRDLKFILRVQSAYSLTLARANLPASYPNSDRSRMRAT
jgi:hypothetical protein